MINVNNHPLEVSSRIYVAGHTGLIGAGFMNRLAKDGYHHVITHCRSELDLTNAAAVESFFQHEQPEFVVLAAGRVGGITDNKTYPADYITENLAMELNVIRSAHRVGICRLLLFGSSCMYPRECSQPMCEDQLLTGKPEPTSIAYAMAKLAGVQMCLAFNRQYGSTRFLPVIPNSAYGPNDNFDPKSSHVLSALLRRFHEARAQGAEIVTLWGTGKPRRELVYVDDIVNACMFLLKADLEQIEFPVNIGAGEDQSIRQLAETIAKVTGYNGRIEWDTSKPDGAPRKLLDCSRLRALGWKPETSLQDGIKTTYQWYLDHTGSEQQDTRL